METKNNSVQQNRARMREYARRSRERYRAKGLNSRGQPFKRLGNKLRFGRRKGNRWINSTKAERMAHIRLMHRARKLKALQFKKEPMLITRTEVLRFCPYCGHDIHKFLEQSVVPVQQSGWHIA